MPFLPAASLFGLAAALAWGCADFLGGMAAKRGPALITTCITHGTALTLAVTLALATGAALPPLHAVLWGFAAGATGATALALFYHILAQGHMGLKTAVAALLAAAIPALIGIVTEGWPHPVQAAGFTLAVVAILLFTYEDGGFAVTEGMGTAALCGVAFAGFYVFTHLAGKVSPFWLGATTRLAALAILLPIIAIVRPTRPANPRGALIFGIASGTCDLAGTLCYITASQLGRLDAAVILSSLYPGMTVLLAFFFLKEKFTGRRALAMLTALVAVPLIAAG